MSLESTISESLKLSPDDLKAAMAALPPGDREKIQEALRSSSSSDGKVKAYALQLAEADMSLDRYAETLSDVLKNWASAWEEDKEKLQAIVGGEQPPPGVSKLLSAAANILACDVAEVLTKVQAGKLLADYAMENKAYEPAADFQGFEEIWSMDFDDYSYCLMLLRNWVFDVLSLAQNFPDPKQRSLIGSMADVASLKGDA